MKQVNLLLLLTFAGISALSAQSKKFQAGAELNAGWSSTTFQYDADPSGLYGVLKAHIGGRPAGGITVFARYHATQRLSIQAGFGYQVSGWKQGRFAVNGEPPAISYPIANAIGIENHAIYRDLLLPVQVRYRFSKSQQGGWYGLAGVAPAYKLAYKNADTVYYNDGSQNTQTSNQPEAFYHKFNVLGQIGCGYEFLVGERLGLYLQPTAGYAFLSTLDTDGLKMQGYSVGLSVGVVY